MDWIEIPLHEFAAYLVELCPSHSPSVNVKEGTFHPIIPTDRFKLFQTSALCIGKAGVDVVQGFDAIRMSDYRTRAAWNKIPSAKITVVSSAALDLGSCKMPTFAPG